MSSSLRIGKLFGITIQLHFSWFIIFALITYALTMTYSDDRPLWLGMVIGILTSVLFFGSVLAHELAHSLVALRNGIAVRSITLFFLGGVAQITREAARPKVEFLVAIAGPLCSLALAAIFGLTWYVVWGNTGQGAQANPIFWLATMNLVLALFNLVPGFPLDGGRVLRAILWHKTRNYRKASKIAAVIGQGVSMLLIAVGLGLVLHNIVYDGGMVFDGLWLAFIGWFLNWAATANYRQAEMRYSLSGVLARDIMDRSYINVPPHLVIKNLAYDWALLGGRRFIMVSENNIPLGVVRYESIHKVPQSRWDEVTVGEIMVPFNATPQAGPAADAVQIMELMEENQVEHVPIMSGNTLLGVVSRDNIHNLLRMRTTLGVQR